MAISDGGIEKKRATIEELSKRVMGSARDLARDIGNLLGPKPDKGNGEPFGTAHGESVPLINALDQIAENLTQTEIALKAACEAFNQLKSRIR